MKDMLLTSHNFPVFTYTPQLVEVLGRELSLAVADETTPADALADGRDGDRTSSPRRTAS